MRIDIHVVLLRPRIAPGECGPSQVMAVFYDATLAFLFADAMARVKPPLGVIWAEHWSGPADVLSAMERYK